MMGPFAAPPGPPGPKGPIFEPLRGLLPPPPEKPEPRGFQLDRVDPGAAAPAGSFPIIDPVPPPPGTMAFIPSPGPPAPPPPPRTDPSSLATEKLALVVVSFTLSKTT